MQKVGTAKRRHFPFTAEPSLQPGDYLHSDRDLYRVERLLEDRALIEDCRTEVLIDISRDRLAGLQRVERRDLD